MKVKTHIQIIRSQICRKKSKIFTTLCLVSCLEVSHAAVLTLSNSNITLNIDQANGAIYSLQYLSNEFTRVGTFVSDWGMQIGTDTTTFKVNDTNGLEQIPVTTFNPGGSSGSIITSGVYSAGGNSILVNRAYSLVTTNLVEITSSFTNLSSPVSGIRYFDTYDPDQGIPYSNYMDVYSLGGFDAACSVASNGYTMILAGEAGFDTVASGGPFIIDDGYSLNSLFTSPVDANGAFLDGGMHSGYEFSLDTGESVQMKHYLALGETKAIAETEIAPEPSSAFLSVFGAALALVRRRK